MQRKVNNRTIANPKHDNLPESKCLPRRWCSVSSARRWCSPQLTESRGGNSRLRWFATSHRPAPRSASLQPIQRSRDAQRHAAAPLREQPTIRPRQSRTGDRGDGIRDHQGGDGIPAFPSAGTERGKWGMDADQPGMEPEADARSRKLSKKRKNALTRPETVPSQGPKRPLGVREPPRQPNRPGNPPNPEPGPGALACCLGRNQRKGFPSRQFWVKPDRLLEYPSGTSALSLRSIMLLDNLMIPLEKAPVPPKDPQEIDHKIGSESRFARASYFICQIRDKETVSFRIIKLSA